MAQPTWRIPGTQAFATCPFSQHPPGLHPTPAERTQVFQEHCSQNATGKQPQRSSRRGGCDVGVTRSFRLSSPGPPETCPVGQCHLETHQLSEQWQFKDKLPHPDTWLGGRRAFCGPEKTGFRSRQREGPMRVPQGHRPGQATETGLQPPPSRGQTSIKGGKSI